MAKLSPEQMAQVAKAYLDTNPTRDFSENDLVEKIGKAVAAGNYSVAIVEANRLKDELRGIKRFVCKKPLGDEVDVVIRDARQQDESHGNIYPDFMEFGLNFVRAAIAVLSVHSRLTSYEERFFKLMASNFVESIALCKEPQQELESFVSSLVAHVASTTKLKLSKVAKQMMVAKDFVNLEDKSVHYLTLYATREASSLTAGQTYFMADLAYYELTQEQQDEIKERYSKCKDPKSGKTKGGWFRHLPRWQQKLLDLYVPLLLEGQRVIPTPLRYYVPGVRNFGRQVSGYKENSASHFTVSLDTFRSGALSHLGPSSRENIRLTKQNAAQVKACNEGHGFTKIGICDTDNHAHIDSKVVKTTRKVAKHEDYDYANYSINPFRKLMRRVSHGGHKQVAHLREELEKINDPDIKNQLEGILTFLKEPKARHKEFSTHFATLKELKPQLNRVDGRYQALYAGLMYSYLLYMTDKESAGNNRNFHIATYMGLMNYYSRQAGFTKKISIISCLSGKDRSRQIMLSMIAHTLFYEFKGHFPGVPLAEEDKPLFNALFRDAVKCYHQQTMAGSPWTSIACMGLKIGIRKPPKAWDQTLYKELALPTCMYNSLMPKLAHKSLNLDTFYEPSKLSRGAVVDELTAQIRRTKRNIQLAHRLLRVDKWLYSRRIASNKVAKLEKAVLILQDGHCDKAKANAELEHLLQSLGWETKGSLFRRGKSYHQVEALQKQVEKMPEFSVVASMVASAA